MSHSEFYAKGAPDGGASDDGESVFMILEGEHGQRLRLSIDRDALASMHSALYQAEEMAHAQDKSRGREISSTIDLCDDPRVYADKEAGIAWVDLRKRGRTVARAGFGVDVGVALATALTESLSTLSIVRSKPN